MKKPPLRFTRLRRTTGFSLIEVTLALGIVTFALVGVVGVLPVALNSCRQSFDETRAAAVANTVFTSFRSQPFQAVCYVDEQFDASGNPLPTPAVPPLDLNASTSANTLNMYATFLDAGTVPATPDAFGDQRHLRFERVQATAADYLITMHFNNQPTGMSIAPQTGVSAQANQVELVVSAVSRPQTVYHFMSTVANRSN